MDCECCGGVIGSNDMPRVLYSSKCDETNEGAGEYSI